MNRTNRLRPNWLLFLLWSLFINVFTLWVVDPLVEDYSILGVVALFCIGGIWVVSIPRQWRKKWLTFTLFAVFLGTGFNSLSFFPPGHRLTWTILMSIAMIIAAFWYARIRVLPMVLSAILLAVCNMWMPFEDWTLLTHFKISYYGKAGLNPMDMPSLPMVVTTRANGTKAIVTLSSYTETKSDVEQAVSTAGVTANDLHNVIQSFNHRYTLIEVGLHDGKFTEAPANPNDLSNLNPVGLYSSFFPMSVAHWAVQSNGNVLQYTVPTLTPLQSEQLTNDAADYPANLLALSETVQSKNTAHWNSLLTQLGVSAKRGLQVESGRLTGEWNGRVIDVPVQSTTLIGTGSFTAPGRQQALLEGANRLQVVDLDTGSGQLVSTFVGSLSSPLSDDIRIGPIDNSGQDVIFVNESPAFILKASASGNWSTLYTAPANSSLRFEGTAVFGSDKTPEIITDDPSYMRPTPIRFLSSYTYRNGQLIRNWRVYRTNVVNVYPVQFANNRPTQLVLSIYNEGKFFILSRHFIPVVPITSGLFALSVLIGFILRIRKGGKRNASSRA